MVRSRKIWRIHVVRRSVGAAAFAVGIASCQSVLDFERGSPAPPDVPGGEGGESTGGRSGTVGGSTGTGGSASGAAGTTPTGGTESTGGTSGSGGEPPDPQGGAGGEAGAGASSGAGGAGGTDDGACTRNEDCPNPDPDCRMECRANGATTECVAIGLDVDGDERLSAACEANPGDDCDDAKESVYGGDNPAQELCDGLDNDCDGDSDLVEFGLGGRVFTISEAANDADLAWSESELTWGVLLATDDGVMYQPMDGAGAMRIDPVRLTPAEIFASSAAIEWGDDEFAIAYGVGDPAVFYRTIAADGTPLIDELPLGDVWDFGADFPALIWLGAGRGWAATWTDFRDNSLQIIARTVSPTGELGAELLLGDGTHSDLASAGGNVAWVWEGIGGFGKLGSDALESAATMLDLGDPASDPAPIITSRADRFSVAAVFPPDKIGVTEFAVNGSILCGPVLRNADGFVPDDSLPSNSVPGLDGFVIFSAQPVVQMLEVLPGCRFGRLIPLDTTGARFVRAARRNDGGFAVVWGDFDQPLKGRIFGPHFCNR